MSHQPKMKYKIIYRGHKPWGWDDTSLLLIIAVPIIIGLILFFLEYLILIGVLLIGFGVGAIFGQTMMRHLLISWMKKQKFPILTDEEAEEIEKKLKQTKDIEINQNAGKS